LEDCHPPSQDCDFPLEDCRPPLQDCDLPLEDSRPPLQDDDLPLEDCHSPLQDDNLPLEQSDLMPCAWLCKPTPPTRPLQPPLKGRLFDAMTAYRKSQSVSLPPLGGDVRRTEGLKWAVSL